MATPSRASRSSTPRKAPPKERLSPERIIDVASAIIDAEGVDALTMRRLAEELGVAATAVYWHVRTRDDLLRGVLERIMDAVELPVVGEVAWDEGLKTLCRSMVHVMAHRHITVLSERVSSQSTFRVFLRMVEILENAGASREYAAESSLLLQTYVYGHASAISKVNEAREGASGMSPEGLANWFRAAGPQSAALLDFYLRVDPWALFERGLNDHVEAMRADVQTVRSPRPTRRRSG